VNWENESSAEKGAAETSSNILSIGRSCESWLSSYKQEENSFDIKSINTNIVQQRHEPS